MTARIRNAIGSRSLDPVNAVCLATSSTAAYWLANANWPILKEWLLRPMGPSTLSTEPISVPSTRTGSSVPSSAATGLTGTRCPAKELFHSGRNAIDNRENSIHFPHQVRLCWPTEIATNQLDGALIDDHMIVRFTSDGRMKIVAGNLFIVQPL